MYCYYIDHAQFLVRYRSRVLFKLFVSSKASTAVSHDSPSMCQPRVSGDNESCPADEAKYIETLARRQPRVHLHMFCSIYEVRREIGFSENSFQANNESADFLLTMYLRACFFIWRGERG
jgi:hypothetical protein